MIKKFLRKLIAEDEQDMELPVADEPTERVTVRVENLGGTADIDRIIKFVREGNILFLKTKELQRKDLGQFQTSVQKLKRSCTSFGFDIAGTEEGYLVVTPKFAAISRN
jgi:SepF-like predicted cell division protein (DUF552 family)